MTKPRKANHRQQIERKTDEVFAEVTKGLRDKRTVIVVRAPPGSGKTYLLCRLAETLSRKKRRLAIAAQTNAQADDICVRLASPPWHVSSYRFVGSGGSMQPSIDRVEVTSRFEYLPRGACVVIGTASKWGLVKVPVPFDVLLVDEAWQTQWSQFVPLGRIASRFVLIGDPGQIPPVASVDASRWETALLPPHIPAPEIITLGRVTDFKVKQFDLPASRRLPPDAVELLQPFYEFPFSAWALPAERAVLAAGRSSDHVDRAIDLLEDGSVVALTESTIEDLPPSNMDEEIADLAVRAAERLIERKSTVRLRDIGGCSKDRRLIAADIGITATHRVMNELIGQRLRRSMALQSVRVDTPERWQGLQRLVTIAVHPLSGVLSPTSFDLETGRLCVMASRHQGGLIIVGRDHIGDTLDGLVVDADQPLGRPDVAGRGHQQHIALWRALDAKKRIVRR